MTNVIRECGSDAIIICGTDSYSSKVDEETAGAERNQADDTVSTPAERTKKRPIIPISIAVGAAVGVDVTMRNRKTESKISKGITKVSIIGYNIH